MIKFNEKIDPEGITKFKVEFKEINENLKVEITKVSLFDETSFQIYLKFNKNEVQDKKLMFTMITEEEGPLMNKNKTKTFEEYPFYVNISFYRSSKMDQMARYTSSGISIAILVGGLAFLLSNPLGAISLFKMLQSLRLLGLINMELPNIVISFTKNLNVSK